MVLGRRFRGCLRVVEDEIVKFLSGHANEPRNISYLKYKATYKATNDKFVAQTSKLSLSIQSQLFKLVIELSRRQKFQNFNTQSLKH